MPSDKDVSRFFLGIKFWQRPIYICSFDKLLRNAFLSPFLFLYSLFHFFFLRPKEREVFFFFKKKRKLQFDEFSRQDMGNWESKFYVYIYLFIKIICYLLFFHYISNNCKFKTQYFFENENLEEKMLSHSYVKSFSKNS